MKTASVSYPIPAVQNLALSLVMIAVQAFLLFMLPLVLLPRYPLSGLWIVALFFTGNLLWALIHEGIHRLLHPVAAVNDRWARILSIVFGNAFDVVKFGHLMHHRYNRDWESEYYDPKAKTYARAALEYYGKLCGGIYLIGFAASLLFLLPSSLVRRLMQKHGGDRAHLPGIHASIERYFFERGRAAIIRRDALAILALYGLSAWTYGSHWPWFALLIGMRAFTVSFMDNIYHYATPMDNSVPSKEVAMPRIAARLFLNGNHHQSHHRHAAVTWRMLPRLAQEQGIACTQSFWQAAREQWHGPIRLQAVSHAGSES